MDSGTLKGAPRGYPRHPKGGTQGVPAILLGLASDPFGSRSAQGAPAIVCLRQADLYRCAKGVVQAGMTREGEKQ